MSESPKWSEVRCGQYEFSIVIVGYINAKYGGPATTMLNATLSVASANRTVLKISDSLYGRVTDGLVNSLSAGWKMLFMDGLKAHIEMME